MGYRTGFDRDQVMLLPEVVDEYVSDDNVVRFVDVFVDHLDIAELGFTHAHPEATGRPPYDPRDLLKLYLYGYMNRVRSSRSLERETKRNLEVIWLLRKLTPDFKTIADFRKDNLVPLKKVSQQFILLCRNLDLLDRTVVGIDGSKIRAWNGKKRNFTRTKLARAIREIDAKIAGYLEDLDRNDRDEADKEAPAGTDVREKIRRFTQRKERYEALNTMLDETGQLQVSLTDPDSRQMLTDQHTEVCFNVQTTVDAKHKIIVDHEVTNEVSDIDQLGSMAIRAKEVLGTEKLTVLADKGYHNANEIKVCVDAGITPCIPEREDTATLKTRFAYDPARDCYICPRGSVLTRGKATLLHKRQVIPYRAKDCRGCSIRAGCTKGKRRTVFRWEHEEILEEMRSRMKGNSTFYRMRQWLCEHPFGTLKRTMDQGYFLLKGLDKVRAEFSLSVLAYNMKRAVKILGVKTLIETIG